MNTVNGRNVEIPPPELRHLIAEVGDLLSELEDLRAKATAARQDATECQFALERAEAADRAALANHARGRRKSPPKLAAPGARKKLADGEQRAAALEQGASDAQGELETAVENRAEEFSARIGSEAEALQGEIRSTLDELQRLTLARMGILALAGWVENRTRYVPLKYGHSLDVRRPNGDRYRLDELLAEIEASLSPSEPKAPSHGAPLRPRPTVPIR
jgi:hypothetical protein